jgi:hypothetical protein
MVSTAPATVGRVVNGLYLLNLMTLFLSLSREIPSSIASRAEANKNPPELRLGRVSFKTGVPISLE